MKAYIQRLGRALMLPVACLPAAALFLGIGYWIDPSGWGGSNVVAAYLCKTGGAILDNLGLLFAVGVAIGMARDKDGASALSALVGFLTVTTIMGSASMFLGFDATKVDWNDLRARQAAYRTEEGQALKAYEEANCACQR